MMMKLKTSQILVWADEHFQRTGKWPKQSSGGLELPPGLSWKNIDSALKQYPRGRKGISSLAQLLESARGVRNKANLPTLSEEIILGWADEFHKRTGSWPTSKSKPVYGAWKERWSAINVALQAGARGLARGSSLARLLNKHRGVRNIQALPDLTEKQVLSWADEYYSRHGIWPTRLSGPVNDTSWQAIETALKNGNRGLTGGSSLARLLHKHRGVRNMQALPPLTEEKILSWADGHFKAEGNWPQRNSGSIQNDTWSRIDQALINGCRGLPGGSSLAKLLEKHRGYEHKLNRARLSEEQILAWADEHYRLTGKWPIVKSGQVAAAPGEKWMQVDSCLALGHRGLPGGSSLAKLLARERGARNLATLPPLTEEQILSWADEHHGELGKWPDLKSGKVADTTWQAIDIALHLGRRGLAGGSSLARLLARHRNVKNRVSQPWLTEEMILYWADDHYSRTGTYPVVKSGRVHAAPDEKWYRIDAALRLGQRGLPGGSSLAKLLAKHRGKANLRARPKLSEEMILAWADAHHRRTGRWPSADTGALHDAPENWKNLDSSLALGRRGLPGGSSLAKLIARHKRASTLEE